jgi:hypothetical protein
MEPLWSPWTIALALRGERRLLAAALAANRTCPHNMKGRRRRPFMCFVMPSRLSSA